MHEVSIRFTAEVTRAFEHNNSYALSLKIADGSKYGGRAECWSDLPVSVGDTVEVTTSQMPYVKTREYTNRDGDTKTGYDLVYPGVTVNVTDRAHSAADKVASVIDDLGGEEIPFHHRGFTRSDAGHLHHRRVVATW